MYYFIIADLLLHDSHDFQGAIDAFEKSVLCINESETRSYHFSILNDFGNVYRKIPFHPESLFSIGQYQDSKDTLKVSFQDKYPRGCLYSSHIPQRIVSIHSIASVKQSMN